MLSDHLEKIKHFLGVARYGSIRKYAIKENISQSAVSKSMQILESALDTPLLVRKRTGVELTQAGAELLNFGDKLNLIISETENNLQKKAELALGGALTIGSYQSIAIYFMPKLLKFIKENQSNLKIKLTNDLSKNLIKAVKDGEIDLCISVNPKPHKSLEHLSLYEDYYSVYKNISMESSNEIYTYLDARDADGISVAEHLAPIETEFSFVSSGDFETAKAMMNAKLGYALLPNWVASPLVENGSAQKVKLKKLPLNFGEHEVALSFKASRSKEPAIEWVSEQTRIMLGI